MRLPPGCAGLTAQACQLQQHVSRDYQAEFGILGAILDRLLSGVLWLAVLAAFGLAVMFAVRYTWRLALVSFPAFGAVIVTAGRRVIIPGYPGTRPAGRDNDRRS